MAQIIQEDLKSNGKCPCEGRTEQRHRKEGRGRDGPGLTQPPSAREGPRETAREGKIVPEASGDTAPGCRRAASRTMRGHAFLLLCHRRMALRMAALGLVSTAGEEPLNVVHG